MYPKLALSPWEGNKLNIVSPHSSVTTTEPSTPPKQEPHNPSPKLSWRLNVNSAPNGRHTLVTTGTPVTWYVPCGALANIPNVSVETISQLVSPAYVSGITVTVIYWLIVSPHAVKLL